MRIQADISVASPRDRRCAPEWQGWIASAAGRILSLRLLDRIYRRRELKGLDPMEFATQVLDVLQISLDLAPGPLAEQVPQDGPVLIVCNHPYVGIEALALAHALRHHRSDLRILANPALRVLPELDGLIISEPLKVTTRNTRSIRACDAHLNAGGALVVCPAGRMSLYDTETRRVADGPWHRLVGHLAIRHRAPVVPVHFEGSNNRLCRAIGRIWPGVQRLLLARELSSLQGRRIRVTVGRGLNAAMWAHENDAARLSSFLRLLVYEQPLLSNRQSGGSGDVLSRPVFRLAAPTPGARMAGEIARLPSTQHLLDFKQFSVFFAARSQAPKVVEQIARERERVRRASGEGSGEARDWGEYDHTYHHLVVWDRDSLEIVGAYRVGRTDELIARYGIRGVYLSQVFDFAPGFHRSAAPALELGRSFVVPEHQKRFHGLYLLWQGIGHLLSRWPRYRRLYGTVSLSHLYDARLAAMLCDLLVEPCEEVGARYPLDVALGPEWSAFRSWCGTCNAPDLSMLCRALDAGRKDLPPLLRHYLKLGARFLAAGTDPNFAETPGLFLEVDVPSVERRALNGFMGPGVVDYLREHSAPGDRSGLERTHVTSSIGTPDSRRTPG